MTWEIFSSYVFMIFFLKRFLPSEVLYPHPNGFHIDHLPYFPKQFLDVLTPIIKVFYGINPVFWLFKAILIAPPQGGFIPYVWEIVGKKNLTIFKGCHYSIFYIIISSSFWKIETKNLNSDPCILMFLILGTSSPAAYSLSKH